LTSGKPGIAGWVGSEGDISPRLDAWLGVEMSALAGGTIAAPQSIAYNGNPAAFTTSVTASGGTSVYYYTWQYSTTSSTAGSGTWYDLDAHNITLDLGTQTETTWNVRKVVDGISTAYSNVLQITVAPETSLDGGTIASSQTVEPGGDPVAFTNTASASGGTGTLTYDWLYSTTTDDPEAAGWFSLSHNYTTLNLGTQENSTWNVRKVTDQSDPMLTSYSNVLKITVQSSPPEGGAGLLLNGIVRPYLINSKDYYFNYEVGGDEGGNPVPSVKVFPFTVIKGDAISHTQYYVLPDNGVYNGSYVGKLYVNCTDSVFNDGGETYTYTEVSGDSAGALGMNAGGMIQVTDATKINYGTNYTYVARVSDTVGVDRYEDVTANIYVAHADSCKFIDMDGPDGTGTYASPWNHCNGQTWITGYYYFLKLGTTSPTNDQIYVENYTGSKSIVFAAYGDGDRPTFQGNSSGFNAFIIGYASDPPDYDRITRNVRVYDINIQGYVSTSGDGSEPFRVNDASEYIEAHRIKVTDARGNACIYFRPHFTPEYYDTPQRVDYWDGHCKIYDCEANDNTGSHGFKMGENLMATNIWGDGNASHFVSSSHAKINYLYVNHSGNSAILIRRSRARLENFVLKGNSATIEIQQPDELFWHPDSAVISNGYIYNTGAYWHNGITFEDENGGHSHTDSIRNIVFVYTGSEANAAGVQFAWGSQVESNNTVIENCVFTGTWTSGIYTNNIDIDNTIIKNNIFYDLSSGYGVNLNSVGSGVKITNNTAYNNNQNDFNLGVSTNVEFRNNSYQDRNTSAYWSPDANNYLYSSGDPYEDKANDNYYPAVGSGLIDTGYDYGTGEDVVGTERPQGSEWDIGAYEFIP
jgi:hypothetical protein